MRHFLWRVLTNSLSSRVHLARRLVQLEVVCPRCGLEPEDTVHALFDCGFARLCLSKRGLDASNFPSNAWGSIDLIFSFLG